jgi:basic membrane protein A and related proteins
MKKLLVLVLLVAMLTVSFVACAPKEEPAAPAPAEEPAKEEPAEEPVMESEPKEEGYEIAMITDSGEIDDKSFNQGTWEGIIEFAESNGKSYKYYKPTEISDNAYLAAIDLAIQGGAKMVVTPGFLFATAVYQAQDKYPDTSFIILDADPNDGDWSAGFPTARIEKNVYAIYYAEHESGFLAGYAAVKDGYTKLGFMGGMAVPAVIRFGYGFAQGAEYAAAEMGIDAIDLKYHYTGDFDATPKNQTTAATWYNDDTEVIFAAGGKIFNSITASAEAADAKVIGVDVDQSADSDTVITSAKKELAVSVQAGLKDFFDGKFQGGVIDTFDITIAGVGLPMDNSRFATFSQADYDAIYAVLVADSSFIVADDGAETVKDLPLEIVSVTVHE